MSAIEWQKPYKGKVCNVHPFDVVFGYGALPVGYILKEVTSRISTGDILRGIVPGRGELLNLPVIEMFRLLEERGIPTAFVDFGDCLPPNMMVQKRLKRFDVEFIYRRFGTGSLIKNYVDTGNYDTPWGNLEELYPDVELQEWMRFDELFFTPTTKPETGHDEDISRDEIVAQGLMTEDQLDRADTLCRRVFGILESYFASLGIVVIIDTKFELCVDEFGNIYVCDEVASLDSSRFLYGAPGQVVPGHSLEAVSKEKVRQMVRDGAKAQGIPEEEYQLTEENIAATLKVYQDGFEALLGYRYEPDDNTDAYVESAKGIIEFVLLDID